MLLARIGQLAIFLICARTLVHFRAKASYEKYIKLLVSLMLLILLAQPLLELFGGGISVQERMDKYENELQAIMQTPSLQGEEIEKILENITQKHVEEKYARVQQEEAKKMQNAQKTEKTEKTGKEAKLEISIEVDAIQKVEIGDYYGESATNNREVSLGEMVSEG